jgi:hypothetical protein
LRWASLQNLRMLKIEPDGGTITRRGIAALAQLTGLKHLQLSNVPKSSMRTWSRSLDCHR